MEFRALVKRCGFGLAVILQWDTLSRDQHFIDSLNLNKWLEIYDATLANSELEKLVLQKIEGLVQTFDDWCYVYDNANEGSELEQLALQKMQQQAKTFDEWRFIYDNAYSGSELEKLALQKMQELIN